MAFPTITSSQLSSRATNAIDDSVTLPASIAAGDLIIIFHFADGAGTRTVPGSWQLIKDAVTSGSVSSVGVAYLIASGGETSVTVTKSITERFSAIAIRIAAANWHGTTPPEISTGTTGSSTGPDPDNLILSGWGSEDTLWIPIVAFDDSAGTGTVSAYPYASDNLKATAVSSAGCGAICSTTSTATSFNPNAFTLNPTDEWWAGTLAVRPAAGGAAYFRKELNLLGVGQIHVMDNQPVPALSLTERDLLIRIDERQTAMKEDLTKITEAIKAKVDNDGEYKELSRKVDQMWDQQNRLQGMTIVVGSISSIVTALIVTFITHTFFK